MNFIVQSLGCVSNSLWLHELQHTRLPCPSLSPRICSNLCLLNGWCHPTILSSAAPFSSGPQSFPASESFPMSWLLASDGQNIGASASAAVLPMNVQGWFPLGLIGLISILSKEISRVFSSTTIRKHQFFSAQTSLWSNSHIYRSTGKTTVLTILTFSSKVRSLLFFKVVPSLQEFSSLLWLESVNFYNKWAEILIRIKSTDHFVEDWFIMLSLRSYKYGLSPPLSSMFYNVMHRGLTCLSLVSFLDIWYFCNFILKLFIGIKNNF